MNPDQTPKLLRLKRYESPPEGYFTSFLEEFHRRQREDVLKRSSRSLFLERLNTYFADLGDQKWAYVPALSLILVGFYGFISVISEPSVPSEPAVVYVDGSSGVLIDPERLERISGKKELMQPGDFEKRSSFDEPQLISPDTLFFPEDY